ncbi:uncharacterized protein WCI35_024220, partial [Daubentonia madagascariensis]
PRLETDQQDLTLQRTGDKHRDGPNVNREILP